MKNPSENIINTITTDLKAKGFTEEEIAMAIKEAKNHYDAYLKKVKNLKHERKEQDNSAPFD